VRRYGSSFLLAPAAAPAPQVAIGERATRRSPQNIQHEAKYPLFTMPPVYVLSNGYMTHTCAGTTGEQPRQFAACYRSTGVVQATGVSDDSEAEGER